MAVQRLISEPRLCALLKLHKNALWYIRTHGRAQSDTRRGKKSTPELLEELEHDKVYDKEGSTATYYYTVKTITDIFYGEGTTRNAHLGLPSVEAILDEEDELLSTTEAGKLLGRRRDDVRETWIEGGHLAAFVLFGGIIRIPASGVAKILERWNDPEAIKLDVAAMLLCRGITTMREWANDKNHPLQRIRENMPGYADHIYVTRESLRSVIKETLPDYLTVDEWWDFRMNHQGPYITLEDLAKLCHTRIPTVAARLVDEKIPHTLTPTRKRRIPVAAVSHWIKEAEVLTPDNLVRIFGTDAIREVPRKYMCRVHWGRSARYCPMRSCIVGYIEAHRTNPHVNPLEWVSTTLEDGGVTTTESLLETIDELTYGDLQTIIKDGWLAGVWIPSHEGHVEHIAVRAEAVRAIEGFVERRRRRRQRLEENNPADGTPRLHYDEFEGL
jgi:hypothetical protein